MTGAASGIGRATAQALAREGADVLCVGREFAGRCPGMPLVVDVCEPDAAETIVAACLEHFGRLDVLVNAEAELTPTPLAELTEADWDAQWELNVIAPMRLMRAAAPVMADAGWGRIVNVASAAGKRPLPANAAYSVTKAAELSLSRVFADRYAGTGVLINAIAPNPGEEDGAGGPPPIGRFGRADEAAAVVVFLCSDASSVVTGAAWSADGGAVKAIV